MKTLNIKNKGLAAALGFAAFAVAMPAVADDYQFIISGYPATNESYAGESIGIALETATRTALTKAQDLEARYRTMDESEGIGMRTDKRKGFSIIIR